VLGEQLGFLDLDALLDAVQDFLVADS